MENHFRQFPLGPVRDAAHAVLSVGRYYETEPEHQTGGVSQVTHEIVDSCTKVEGMAPAPLSVAVTPSGAPGYADLARRPLLVADDAERLADTFSLLSSSTRLRLLHALARRGELCVKDLAAEVGMSSSAVCNQLQRLVDRRILAARRDGNFVHYRIEDPCLVQLIEAGLCMTLLGPGDACPR